jgi:hypothetical protein
MLAAGAGSDFGGLGYVADLLHLVASSDESARRAAVFY